MDGYWARVETYLSGLSNAPKRQLRSRIDGEKQQIQIHAQGGQGGWERFL